MQRKEFIQLGSYASFALLTFSFISCERAYANAAANTPFIFSHLANKDKISDVGKAYRSAFPSEDDPGLLYTLILKNNGISPSGTPEVIRSSLNAQVQKEFKQGHTVVVKGWVLSLTEARQCALFSLVNT